MSQSIDLGKPQADDPAVMKALETFTVAASKRDLYEAIYRYLDDPKTPRAVRLLIGQIINTADKLAASQLVVA